MLSKGTDKTNYARISVDTHDEGGMSDEDDTIEIEVVKHEPDVITSEEKKENDDIHIDLQRLPTLQNLLWRSIGTKSVFNQENSEYADHFMDFDHLRYLLDNVAENKPQARSPFLEFLDSEWNKYQSFAESEAMRINQYPVEKYVMVNILKYNQFVSITQRMLNVLIREYDSMTLDGSLSSIWGWKINWNPQKMLFALMKKISNLYEKQRSSPKDHLGQSIDEFSFDRESTKYFVKRSNILQVIGVIIQHLPIYVFGDDDKKSPRVSGHISSVYFDTDDFKCYGERVGKEEGARAFRIRWYGEIEPGNENDIVFLERKIHHITSMGHGPSMKERFKMKSGKVRAFLNGSIKIPDDSKNSKLQNEIYEFVKEYKMRPKTRTVCDRMSFQLSYNNDLRISLDLNLKFVKEKSNLFESDNLWFSSLDQLNEVDLAVFPFDILEIKMAGKYSDNPPQWIQDLMDSTLLVDCYKFSKYGQSVNEFYQDKIELIPRWIENVDILNKDYKNSTSDDKKTEATKKIGIYDVDKEKEKEKEIKKNQLYKYWRCVCWCDKNERKRKAKPVNPKVHFSNERTFLQWFKAAIFIGSSGISIHAMVPDDAAGYIMVGAALIILAWGLVVYYVRNWKLVTGNMEGLHDFWGPGFLGMVLVFVFIYALLDPGIAAAGGLS